MRRVELRIENRDEKGHKDCEIHVRKAMQGKKKQNKVRSQTPAKGVGGCLLLQSLCGVLMYSWAWAVCCLSLSLVTAGVR